MMASFVATSPGKVYQHVIRYMSWPHIQLFKKHQAVAYCADVPKQLTAFRKQWKKGKRYLQNHIPAVPTVYLLRVL
jgi:hypothetical protein